MHEEDDVKRNVKTVCFISDAGKTGANSRYVIEYYGLMYKKMIIL